MRAVVAGRLFPRDDIAAHGGPAGCRDITFRVEPMGPLAELERDWRRLEADAAPSFFLSWNWIGTLLETIPPEVAPRLLRGTVGGRTVALGVLGDASIRRHRVVRARRWVLNATGDPEFDCVHLEHNGLLAAPQAGWAGLLDAFANTAGVDEIGLPGVAAPPPVALVEQRGLLRHETPELSFAVDLGALDDSGGDVAAILSRNSRSQFRRALHRLEPARLEAATSPAEAIDFFRTLKELHVPWWERRGLPHAFVHDFFEHFHERLIERGFAEGAIELLRLRSADRTLGVLYNFRRGSQVYAYQSGFVQPSEHERPGVVAHALAIRRAWQQGARVYDFMAGENQLKRSFGNRIQTLSWTVVQKPRLRFRAERLALGGMRRTIPPHQTGPGNGPR